MSSLRRPASSTSLNPKPAQKPRTKAPSVAAQPPPTRKPLSNITTQQARVSNANAAANTVDDASRKKANEPGETNIQVVVRVRGYAPNEPVPSDQTLTTSGPRCQQIDVAMEPAPVSSSATLQSEPASTRSKSYHFDHVFGPEADQGMLYQDVVGPILEQVMAGYNCTIFAYGQTGTGKTYTMEGDLTSQPGTYSADAGIIPRMLYRLFHTLEMGKFADYSVKSTFIELYNEELRDLFSTDASAPIEQSVGTNQHGLRMYDDARGKGVVIQGLEEKLLTDAAHGLQMLRQGSHKRQIAATNCNEQSSRSHSVFTMTVFMKEKGSKGEEVVKVGKLNLVDLAGSENIGRSGAENKRAREAGMINQSLLTLGRVINALVEKNSHIPYRESKLTRILQESLGGRTKTCIIATVSQDRSNIEETLSTLDYALRAKSIKNRPELNTRIASGALLKDYAEKIARLQAELQASRDQDGVWHSKEDWAALQAKSDEDNLAKETAKRTIEVLESKQASSQEQMEHLTQLSVKRAEDARIANEARQQVEDRVAGLEGQVAALSAHNHQLAGECHGLSEKLDRKSAVLYSNHAQAVTSGQLLSDKAADVKTELSAIDQDMVNFLADLQASVADLPGQVESPVAQLVEKPLLRLKQLSTLLREARSKGTETKEVVAALEQAVQAAIADQQTELESTFSSAQQTYRAAIDDVAAALKGRLQTVSSCVSDMVRSHTQELDRVAIDTAAEMGKIAQSSSATDKALEEEGERLRAVMSHVASTLDALRDQLGAGEAGFGAALRTFAASRSEESAAVSHLRAGLSGQLEAASQAIVSKASNVEQKLSQTSDQADADLVALGSAAEQDFDSLQETVSRGFARIPPLAATAREKVEANAKSQSAILKSANGDVSEIREQLGQVPHFVSDVTKTAADHLAESTCVQEARRAKLQTVMSQIAALQAEADAISTGQQEDLPTGQTPHKRRWQLPATADSPSADLDA